MKGNIVISACTVLWAVLLTLLILFGEVSWISIISIWLIALTLVVSRIHINELS